MPGTPDAPASASAGSVLGFDFGKRMIGVAVGNPLSGAHALTTVGHGSEQPDWRRIDALIAEWHPACLVVGLPLARDGGEQPMTTAARHFAAELERRYETPVHMIDERYTSLEASRRFAGQRAAGAARRKDAAGLDAIAAEIILESWLTRDPDPA